MSQGIDIKFIRENYQRFTDNELIHAATKNAANLTPEAQEVLKEEIAKRGLDQSIIKGVEAQNKRYSREDIDNYCKLIRDLDCPICGSSSAKLNGTLTSEVMSFILFTQHSKKLRVGCPNCLDKLNNDALTKTALAGWWGIPWGIIKTIQAIKLNMKSKKSHHIDTPNDYLRSFTLSRIGQLETYKENTQKLQEMVSS